MTVYAPQILEGASLLLREAQNVLASDLGVSILSTVGTSTVLVSGTAFSNISSVNISVEEDEAFFGVFNANIAQDATPGTESYLKIVVSALETATREYKFGVASSVESGRGALAFAAFYQGEGKPGGTPPTLTAQFGSAVGANLRSFNFQWLTFVGKKRKYNDRIFA